MDRSLRRLVVSGLRRNIMAEDHDGKGKRYEKVKFLGEGQVDKGY